MNIQSLTSLMPLASSTTPTQATSASGGAVFADILQSMVNSNDRANSKVDAAITDLATGEAQDLHTVSLAVAEADLNFRLLLEVRNRLTEAFQEVMRIQV